ncbi:hypothetical protein ACQ4LE_010168 [Meloidogyne hapla]
MEIEHSYFCNLSLPKFSQVIDLCNESESNILSKTSPTTINNNFHEYAKKIQKEQPKRKESRLSIPQGSDLEDDDLHFKGFCYSSFDGQKTLNETYFCYNCPAIFDSRVGLTNHLKLHGAENKLKCNLCDFSCTNKKTMRVHRRIHGVPAVRGRRPNSKRQNNKKIRKPKNSPSKDEKTLNECSGSKLNETDELQSTHFQRITRSRIARENNNSSSVGVVIDNNGKKKKLKSSFDDEQFVIIPNRKKNNKKYLEDEKVFDEESHQKNGISTNNKLKRPFSPIKNEDSKNLFCKHCSYKTTNQSNFDQHIYGHSRVSGYVCSICNFKHEYKRWLLHHCNLHKGLHYKWPPEYIYGEV